MAVRPRQHVGSIAALVAAAVVGVFFYLDQGKVTDKERGDRVHDVFPAYRRADIDYVELQVPGATKLRIERRRETQKPQDPEDTYWQMTSPVDERADPAAVDRFIGDLEFAGVIRTVDPGVAEVAKSFDPPRVTGTLAMKSLVYRFALGGPAPVPAGSAYFRVDGEGTFVVSKDFVDAVLHDASTYRDRTVVPYLSLDLAELHVVSPSGELTVTRADDVAFKLKNGLRASREGLDKVWGALAEARASSFLSDADADRILASASPPPVRVTMVPKDTTKPRGELALGGACPGHPDDIVFVRAAPRRVSACVPSGALPGLGATDEALVDRRLFVARADETEELTLETVPAGYTVELARKGRGWHARKPEDRELGSVEVDLVNDLVTKLTRGEASRVERDASPGFSPRARARLRRASSGAEEVVELSGTDRVRRAFDGALLHVPPELAHRLWPSEITLRGRGVFPANAAAEGTLPVAVSTECDGVKQAVTRAGQAWTMREPKGFAVDALAVADLAGLVRNAQAESWIADRDDGTFGLGEPACHIEVRLAAGSDAGGSVLGLTFGRESPEGGFFARTAGDGAVFLASRALREAAKTWLVDRGGFHVDRQAVVDVTLSRGHGVTKVLPGPAAAAAPARPAEADGGARDPAARVLDVLEGLRPEAVAHIGPALPAEGFAVPSLDVRVRLRADGGRGRDLHFVLGDTTLIERERMVYLREDGVDATFAVARERVASLLEAL